MRNLAHANPAEFSYPSRIDSKAHITFKYGPWRGQAVRFLIVGTVVSSSVQSGDHNRLISIAPTDYSLGRLVAVIHQVTGQALMNVTSSYGGMVISTKYGM